MKIICHREAFLSACQLVGVAVAARNVNPVLQNLKVIAGGDGGTGSETRCTLIATDTEVGIRMDVRSVNVEETGEALLPSARMVSILREAQDEEITIESDPGGITLRGAHVEYEMPGEDASIFPEFPVASDEAFHEIDAAALREMLKRTTFAVANAEHTTKWGATTGVLWELDGGKARLVATDGRRLACCDGPAVAHGGHSVATSQGPVVPIKAMQLLAKNLQDGDGAVKVTFRPNEILIKTERSTIYSRLLEGRFPNYKRAMPKEKDCKVRVPIVGGTFAASVRQAAIMTSQESMSVILSFTKDKVTMRAQGSDTGKSCVEMEVEYDAAPMQISFDPRYLVEVLRAFDPETKFSLELTDEKSLAVLRNEAGDYAYVILPLVVRGGDGKK